MVEMDQQLMIERQLGIERVEYWSDWRLVMATSALMLDLVLEMEDVLIDLVQRMEVLIDLVQGLEVLIELVQAMEVMIDLAQGMEVLIDLVQGMEVVVMDCVAAWTRFSCGFWQRLSQTYQICHLDPSNLPKVGPQTMEGEV